MKYKKIFIIEMLVLVVLIGIGIVSLSRSANDFQAKKASTGLEASVGQAADLGSGELPPPTDLEVFVE